MEPVVILFDHMSCRVHIQYMVPCSPLLFPRHPEPNKIDVGHALSFSVSLHFEKVSLAAAAILSYVLQLVAA